MKSNEPTMISRSWTMQDTTTDVLIEATLTLRIMAPPIGDSMEHVVGRQIKNSALMTVERVSDMYAFAYKYPEETELVRQLAKTYGQ